ncbi:hypothetical protein [Cellulosimicrobium sp. NPDC057127]|uniref:amidohydrolase family protein n=1 Tax=Cellulosimicrobium sp. NPDC057127 TaxID=3346026 RepID=UPI00362B0B82
MTSPVPDAARVVTVDASWFPGRPPTGPTSFLATASGLRRRSDAEIDPSAATSALGRPTPDVRVDFADHRAPDPLHLPGTLLPPFTDAHVHLGLIDATALVPHGIAAVHDLGWIPEEVAAWARDGDDAGRARGATSEAKGVEAARGHGQRTAGGDGAASPSADGAPLADPTRLPSTEDAPSANPTRRMPHVTFAGAFLTAPGGYPSDRSWAPDGSVVEIATPDEAVAAVDRQLASGASFVKVALNSDAGPVPDDATLAAVVGRAHERGVAVVAHAEGPGQAAQAFEAGVDRLAHAPFSERLPDALLLAMARPRPRSGSRAEHDTARRRARPERRPAPENDAQVVFGRAGTGRTTWVSTLDIHGWGTPTPEQDVAVDNVRRFVALGGTVVYGTDLGNGALPLGVNPGELRALVAAGLGADDLVRALTSGVPRPSTVERRVTAREMRPWAQHSDTDAALAATGRGAVVGAVTYVPGPPPTRLTDLDRLDGPDELAELTRWLAGATTLHLADVLQPAFAPPSGTTREDHR